jgi:HAD superfamily phosphatase (TIGR01668 family)
MSTPSELTAALADQRDLFRLFTPCWFARSLFEVTAARLKSLGVEGLMLDMDNTLTEWHSMDLTPTVVAWLGHLRDAGIQTCVVSNTNRVDRLQRLCDPHGVAYVLGVQKPRRRGFRLALEKMGTPLERTAIAGDQIFTDVFGGNRMGLYTILVPPLSPREFLGTKWISRNLERVLFAFMERTRRYPPRVPDVPERSDPGSEPAG